ncbi:MAG: hypothetical protein AAF408_16990, partial [Pseudomonadota bacterium]
DYQAFRAGFREGVKLNMADGQTAYQAHPDLGKARALHLHVGDRNLDRLKVWCSVGADVERGDWAIFGARLGCVMTALQGFDVSKVANYGWIEYFWTERVVPEYSDDRVRAEKSRELCEKINGALDLGITELDPEASAHFKSQYRGHRAYGAMRVV